jgi:hypothetical protein
MNCKPGDLAIVVRKLLPRSNLEVGNIVRCLELRAWMLAPDDNIYLNVWLVEKGDQRRGPNGYPLGTADECLRPIRPGDLEDETPTVRELEAA